MARSSVVYVVLKRGKPVAGFTVKHELVTWFEHRGNSSLKVWRMADKPSWFYTSEKPPVEITDEITQLALGS